MGFARVTDADDWSREAPCPGFICYQPRKGYRFGVEAYALASFALDGGAAKTAVDLGTGSGIVALLLASQGLDIVAVERDERWRPMLERSIQENAARVAVLWGDVRSLALPSVDLVVSNPPWFDLRTGPVSPNDHKAHGRSTFFGEPADFVRAGLTAAARVCVVVPVSIGLPTVAGASLARRARYGGLCLGEFRRGEGDTVDVDVDPYGRFRFPVARPEAAP